jgi:hypothetical protein
MGLPLPGLLRQRVLHRLVLLLLGSPELPDAFLQGAVDVDEPVLQR